MARMLTTALFFAFLAISVNAQAPAATPDASPETAVPTTSPSGIAETPEAELELGVPAMSPSFSAETAEAGVPVSSQSIAAAPDSESTTDADTPSEAPGPSFSITAAPSSSEYVPSIAPDTAPSVEAPGSEPYDFADGPISDSLDTTIESPPSPLISEAPATAPSSPSSGAIRTESGFAFAGLVASVLVVAALKWSYGSR